MSEVSLIAGLLDSTIGQAGTAPPENYNNQNSRPEGNPRNPLSEGPPLPPKHNTGPHAQDWCIFPESTSAQRPSLVLQLFKLAVDGGPSFHVAQK